ncbi:MAG: universal stress protein [Frankiales bacterium]|nr:universal stress protein [Frankiales bacterium]
MSTSDPVGPCIVVGINATEHSAAALRWAIDVGVRGGLPVTAIAAWQWPASTAAGPMTPYLPDDVTASTRLAAEQQIARVTGEFGLARHSVHLEVVQGEPGRVLVGRSRGARLLVIGNPGRRHVAATALGSGLRYCLTHADCPVVTVPGVGDHPHSRQRARDAASA